MNTTRLFLCLCFLFFVNGTFANELPVIELNDGANTIALTVVNQSGGDLSGMTVNVDKSKLPGWLSFQSVSNTIDVRSGEKGQDKLYVKFIVAGAPFGVEADIPLILEDVMGNRWSHTATVRVTSNEPLTYALYDNFPNPFNPSTTIRYSLKDAQHTKLTIYNALGQKIRTIVDEPRAAGIHTIQWNGRNDSGWQVSSGVYFYRIEAGKFVQTRKMMMVE